MPLVKIEILKGNSKEYKMAIFDAVHESLVESIKIPDHDRFQRIYEVDKENFDIPPTKTEKAIIIEITMFKGRSLEAKKALYKNIVERLAKNPGISGDDITIVILEPSLENWGIKGGKPASEVDLGFKIQV
jgi:phenylpyruvate tautomerase PptA (4-oxalocrotonate tautomerase family)